VRGPGEGCQERKKWNIGLPDGCKKEGRVCGCKTRKSNGKYWMKKQKEWKAQEERRMKQLSE